MIAASPKFFILLPDFIEYFSTPPSFDLRYNLISKKKSNLMKKIIEMLDKNLF